jgi:hypothetical protein
MRHTSRHRAAAAAMLKVRQLLVIPAGWRSHHASQTGDLLMLGDDRQVSISLLSWSVLHTWRVQADERSRYARFPEGDVTGLAARANHELTIDPTHVPGDRIERAHSTP